MNKIFKVIWNHATQSWVAVSELSKSKTKTASKVGSKTRLLNLSKATSLLSICLLGSLSTTAFGAVTSINRNQTADGNSPLSAVPENSWVYQNGYLQLRTVSLVGPFKTLRQALHINAASGTDSYALVLGATDSQAAKSERGNAVVIGGNALNQGHQGTAIGFGTTVEAYGGTALGALATARSNDSTAIGTYSEAQGDQSVAFGASATTSASRSVALGASTQATVDKSVALGSDSTTSNGVTTTSATVGGIIYNGFTGNADSVVSVGSNSLRRQIQNVAAGQISSSSTDAINGSQLYAVMDRVSKGLNFIGNDGTVIPKKLGETLAIKGGKTNNTGVSDKNTYVARNTSGELIVKFAETPEFKGVNLTDGSNTVNLTPTANGLNVSKANGNPTKITNLENGTLSPTSKDAVNGSQLYSTNLNVTNLTNEVAKGWNLTTTQSSGHAEGSNEEQINMGELVTFDAGNNINITQTGNKISIATTSKPTFETVNLTSGGNTVNFASTADGLTLSNSTGSPVKISGVANGTISSTSTEAVNGSQLYATEKGLTDKGLNFLGNDQTATKIHKNLGETLSVVGGVAVASKETTSDINTYVDNNGTALVVKIKKNPEFEGVTVNTSGSMVNLTSNATGLVVGNSAGNPTKIQNVEDGTLSPTSKEAVNGSQLYSTNQNVTNLTNEVAKGWNLTTSKSAGGNVEGTSQEQINMGELVTFDAGSNINITQSLNKISIATSSKPTFENVTLVSGGNSVNLSPTTNGLNVSKANGDAAKIGNVADGEISDTSKDAINGSQLYTVNKNLIEKGINFTGNNVNTPVHKNLGETLTIKGGQADNSAVSDVNTYVDRDTNGNLVVKFAETPVVKGVNLTNAGNTVTLTPTTNGLTVGDQNGQPVKITNVKAGTDPNDAVNLSQLNATKTFVKSGSSNVVVEPTQNTTTGGTDYTITVSENPVPNTVWKLNVSNSTGGASSGSETTVANDNTVTIDAGQNIEVAQTDRKISIKTSANPTFETVNLTKSGNTVNFDPTTDGLTLSNATGSPVKISGVANGTVSSTSTEAVNGSQLYATEKGLTEKGLNFVANDGTPVHKNLGETLAIKGGKANDSDISDKNTYVARNASGELIVKFAETPEFKGVNLTDGTSTVNLTPTANGLNVSKANGDAAKIDNVADGDVSSTSKQAVNGSQLYSTNLNVTNLTNEVAKGWNLTTTQSSGHAEGSNQEQINMGELVTFDAGSNINITQTNNTISIATTSKPTFETVNLTSGGNTVNLAPTSDGLTLSNATGSPVKISGVANGTVSPTSTEAVNGSQLYATEKGLTDKGLNFLGNDGTAIHKNLGETLAIKGGKANDSDISDKNTYVARNASGELIVKFAETPEFKGVNLTDGSNTVNLTPTTNGLNVSKANGDAATIDNVADGDVSSTSKQAVNGSQLYHSINNLTDLGLNFIGNDGALASIHKNLGETLSVVGGVAVASKEATSDINTYVDNNGTALIVKIKKTPEFEGVTVNTSGSMVNLTSNATGLVVGNSAGNPTKIQNVEDGTLSPTSKEAVNGSQLYSTNQNVTNLTNEVAKGWNLTTTQSGGHAEGSNEEQINMGELVTFDAGSNINITQTNNTISIATTSKPTFETVNLTSGGNTVNFASTADGLTLSNSTGSPVKISGVANGTVSSTSTEAVNGSQLYATEKGLIDKGLNFVANDGTPVHKNLGETLAIKGGKANDSDISDKNTYVARNASGELIVKFAETPEFKGVNLTDGSNTVNLTPTANGLNVSKANGDAATIDNVADGDVSSTSKQAVNGSQLYNSINDLTNLGLNFIGNEGALTAIHKNLGETLSVVGGVAVASKETTSDINTYVDNNGTALVVKIKKKPEFEGVTVNTSGSMVNLTSNATGLVVGNSAGNPTKIQNVEDGTLSPTSKDAVNGSQLYATNQNVTNLTNEVAKGWNLTTTQSSGHAEGSNEEQINMGELVTFDAGNNINITQTNNTISIATTSKPTFETVNLTSGSNTVNFASTADGLNLSNSTGSPVKISGVANGTISSTSTEAVNGSQLYATEKGLTAKGLYFTGDNEKRVVHKNLGDTLSIVGNLDDSEPVTDENLRVDAEDNKLIIKMAKSLTDLTNATFTNGNITTKVGDNGITVSNVANPNQTPVRLTEKGLDNGNHVITNVSAGVNGTDAVNVDQLERVNQTANAGWTLSTNNGTATSNVKPNATVDLSNTDGNINISQNGNNVVFNLNPTTTLGGKGKDGQDGVDGLIGVKGADGKTGVTLNGKDGSIGINGKDGKDASITVAEGKTTVDPKDGNDGITRIVYETTRPVLDDNGNPKTDENGNIITENVTRQVATMDDGLNFIGDKGGKVAKKLGETLAIKGNVDVNAPVTDKNLRVDNESGSLILKMAKSLTDLTNATFTHGDVKTVVGDNGITVSNTANPNQAPVRLTEKGLDNGNNTITNVAPGVNGTDAVNVNQLKQVSDVANAGWTLSTNNGTATSNVKPNATVDLSNTDGNINISQNGNNVVFNLNPTTILGGNGKDGEIGAKGADGKTGVTLNGKDGSIGINGKDGSNASLTVADGKTTVDPKDGNDGITRIVYETTRPVLDDNGNPKTDENGNIITENVPRQVATMDDGLIFAGDKGETAQKLGTKLTVTGGADLSKLADNNIGVVAENGKLSVKLAKHINLGDNSKVQTGNVSISSEGINAGGNKVSNVADGSLSPTSQDAVNGSQLHATNQNVSKVQNDVAKGWNVTTSKSGTGNVKGTSVANVKMGDTATVDAGNNINITQSGRKISIATSSKPTFETVTATQSVNIGQGNNAVNLSNDKAGNLVINQGKKPAQIKGVAAGTADTDAVNVAQLKGVNNHINNVNKKLRGGIASAAASGGIPQVYIPGKSMLGAAASAYKGASAVAVGYSRASDNGKVILKVSGSANSQGEMLGTVGVGYQW